MIKYLFQVSNSNYNKSINWNSYDKMNEDIINLINDKKLDEKQYNKFKPCPCKLIKFNSSQALKIPKFC